MAHSGVRFLYIFSDGEAHKRRSVLEKLSPFPSRRAWINRLIKVLLYSDVMCKLFCSFVMQLIGWRMTN